jgi:hypothetical protein
MDYSKLEILWFLKFKCNIEKFFLKGDITTNYTFLPIISISNDLLFKVKSKNLRIKILKMLFIKLYLPKI